MNPHDTREHEADPAIAIKTAEGAKGASYECGDR
jgi:hypothetical protein